MKGLDKVVWAEGVLLGQQHFQAWDKYHASVLNFQRNALNSHSWGIISLAWDEVSLTEGRLEIIRLKAIFPNGRLIDFHRDTHGALSLELFNEDQADFKVCVTLANNDQVSGISGYPAQSRLASWTADYLDILDDSDSARQREVMFAKPNLHLTPIEKVSTKMLSLNCLRVERLFDGAYQVILTDVPVCLQLKASRHLISLLQSLVDLLSTKVRAFAQRRLMLGDLDSFSSSENADFFFHKGLNEFLLEARNLLEDISAHPYKLYQLLSKLHQHCALFLQPDLLDKAPVYKHENIGEPFNKMLADIKRIVDTKETRVESHVSLSSLGSGRYRSNAISDRYFANSHFYLAVDYQQDNLDWLGSFPGMCKLAAPEKVELLVASGLTGVELVHCQRLPQKIRIKSGVEYFEIIQKGGLWDEIRDAQALEIFCLSDFSNAEIELLVVEKSN